MSYEKAEEAQLVLLTILNALNGASAGATGALAADLFYAIGDLQAEAETLILEGGLGPALANVFELATAAGATLRGMEVVRVTALTMKPRYRFGGFLAIYAAQLALAQEVKIVGATTFVSSQDALATLSFMNRAFMYSVEFAADNRDPTSYQTLISAHAACVRDLTTRATNLPALTTYKFGRVMTSHALANRLYGDASRCDELRAENKAIAPAFMPITGSALAN